MAAVETHIEREHAPDISRLVRQPLPVFRHQVGGHCPLLWNSGRICKPANERELDFYVHADKSYPQLLAFMPAFFGVVDLPSTAVQENAQQPANAPTPMSDVSSPMSTQDSPPRPEKKSSVEYNSWGQKCAERKRTLQVQTYMLLEDLTSKFRRPSVLDLKLGTRQHGSDDPPEKVQSKLARCSDTTSFTMGVRFCGSQVYLPQTGSFQFRNKYYGRQLTSHTFFDALREFFFDGNSLRLDVVQALVRRLQQLRNVIAGLRHVRFFSSSLLMIYEGSVTYDQSTPDGSSAFGLSQSEPAVDMRMIDFAKTERVEEDTPDEGVLRGIDNLIFGMQGMLDQAKRASGPVHTFSSSSLTSSSSTTDMHTVASP